MSTCLGISLFMANSMKIAFIVFGNESWIGGLNYLKNILAAINESGSDVEPVLFYYPDVSKDVLNQLLPYSRFKPIEICCGGSVVSKVIYKIFSFIVQKDYLLEDLFKRNGVDVVFQHGMWFGFRFSLPTLAWIADFQHKYLPNMFSFYSIFKRNFGYFALSISATKIMVSSQSAYADCINFYPMAKGKVLVLPFRVALPSDRTFESLSGISLKYSLPSKFIYFPAQFWRHKNHMGLLQAISILKSRGLDIIVVASGSPIDPRNKKYPNSILGYAKTNFLSHNFRFIGLIDYDDVGALIRLSGALINPSFFEGWSTTVEEAQSVGSWLLLSNISVHKEQASEGVVFFDPNSPTEIADVLEGFWNSHEFFLNRNRPGENIYLMKRDVFRKNLIEIIRSTAASGGH